MEEIKFNNKLFWNTLHEVDPTEDFLEAILKGYGIEDIDAFLQAGNNKSNIHDPFLLKNMKKAVKLVNKVLKKKKGDIIVLLNVDPDCDGYNSSSYFAQALKALSPRVKIHYAMHFRKEHGLTIEDVDTAVARLFPWESFDLIVVPDAGSGSESIKEYQAIKDKYDVPVLVLDHHELATTKQYSKAELKKLGKPEEEATAEDYEKLKHKVVPDKELHKNAIIVNCQDGSYPNTNLSGVGVVHKFFEAYAEEFELDVAMFNKYLDLVALGMTADMMSLKDLESRYYVLQGLMNINNGFFKEMIARFEKDLSFGCTIKALGWTIAPKINGTCRYGEPKEQYDVFRAMVGDEETLEYQPRRERGSDKNAPAPELEHQTLQKYMARVACNAKARQDKDTTALMNMLDEHIIDKGLDKNSIMFIDTTDMTIKKTLTGLVANKLIRKYNRPVIILKPRKDDPTLFGGSGRGFPKSGIKNFNEYLSELNVFEYCEGHPNAFGIGLKKDRVDEAIAKANKGLNVEDIKTIHDVQYEFKADDLTEKGIMEIANAYKLWGNGVPEPTFAITDIMVNQSHIYDYGQYEGANIRLEYNGMKFIKKYCKKGEFNELRMNSRETLGVGTETLNLTVLAHFELNDYKGNITPVIRISDFYSVVADKQVPLKKQPKKSAVTKAKEVEQKGDIDGLSLDDLW